MSARPSSFRHQKARQHAQHSGAPIPCSPTPRITSFLFCFVGTYSTRVDCTNPCESQMDKQLPNQLSAHISTRTVYVQSYLSPRAESYRNHFLKSCSPVIGRGNIHQQTYTYSTLPLSFFPPSLLPPKKSCPNVIIAVRNAIHGQSAVKPFQIICVVIEITFWQGLRRP